MGEGRGYAGQAGQVARIYYVWPRLLPALECCCRGWPWVQVSGTLYLYPPQEGLFGGIHSFDWFVV